MVNYDSGLSDNDIKDDYYRFAVNPSNYDPSSVVHYINGRLVVIISKIMQLNQDTIYRINLPDNTSPTYIIEAKASQLFPVIGCKAIWKDAARTDSFTYDIMVRIKTIYKDGTVLVETDFGDEEMISLNELELIKNDWEYRLKTSHQCSCSTKTLIMNGCTCGGD